MKKFIALFSLSLLLTTLTTSPASAQSELNIESQELIEIAFACDFPREIKSDQKVEICIIGRGPENAIKRDITSENGLDLKAEFVVGSGDLRVHKETKNGYNTITFTPDSASSLVSIEITGTYKETSKKIFATLIISDTDRNAEPKDPNETSTDEEQFPDVATDHKNAAAIKYLFDEKIIEGYPDGTFKPEQGVNRAEILKIIIEGLGINPDADQYKNCFPDVKEEWFAKYVCYAKDQKWVEGYPKENIPESEWRFLPEITVNKVEALKIAINAFNLPKATIEEVKLEFQDTEKDAWYQKYIQEAANRILIDDTRGKFKPNASMTRASISEIIYRLAVINRFKAIEFKAELLEEVESTDPI